MGDVESHGSFCRRRVLIPVLAVALGVASAGCAKPPQATPSAEADCKLMVKRVCIDEQGNADPDPVKVKKKQEIVVWIAPEGTVLDIQFAENPFPQPVICAGDRFCASLLPPAGEEKSYEYTAKVTRAAVTKSSDPRL